MEFKVTVDEDDGEVLSMYLRIRQGKVHRTVQISEGECYVDEDDQGKALGVEMLVPGTLKLSAKKVATRYNLPRVTQVVDKVSRQFATS